MPIGSAADQSTGSSAALDARLWGLSYTLVQVERGITGRGGLRALAIDHLMNEGHLAREQRNGGASEAGALRLALSEYGASSLVDVADDILLPEAVAEYRHQMRHRQPLPPGGRRVPQTGITRDAAVRLSAPLLTGTPAETTSSTLASGRSAERGTVLRKPVEMVALRYQCAAPPEEAERGAERLIKFLGALGSRPSTRG